jgi:hypothetical protein
MEALKKGNRIVTKSVGLNELNNFVSTYHRHHGPVAGFKRALGLYRDGELIGVGCLSIPRSRMLAAQEPHTLEITRLCVLPIPNACSFLLSRLVLAGRTLGATSLITYTLPEEGGASLRAANWRFDGLTRGGTWNRPSRARSDKAPTSRKVRWRYNLS